MLKEMTTHTIIDAGVKPAVVTDILIDEETLEKHQVLMDARHSTDEIRKGSMPSSMTHKTSLNDKLIEYTIEFEEAFDYINNVR